MAVARAALSLPLVAVVVAVPAPPAHAAAYSAPLRTAARQLPVAAENNDGYDRDRYFGADWTDANGDCQNTRHEVLIKESTIAPTYSKGGCTVVRGSWFSYFDSKVHSDPLAVQIDHLVPVAEAWSSGARRWTQGRRVAFYNDIGDPRELNAVTSAVNQDKVAYGPEDWMPRTNRCRYIAEWVALKHRWGLTVDNRERAALVAYADSCPDVTVTVSKA